MKITKLYSDYQEEERLYSTGNDELDELMERAFCDGYEYAQKEFAFRDYAGLTPEQASALRDKRNSLAKNLNDSRNLENQFLKSGYIFPSIKKGEFTMQSRNEGYNRIKPTLNYLKQEARQSAIKENPMKLSQKVKTALNTKKGKIASIGAGAGAVSIGVAAKKFGPKIVNALKKRI